jgi:hypothetical protein
MIRDLLCVLDCPTILQVGGDAGAQGTADRGGGNFMSKFEPSAVMM